MDKKPDDHHSEEQVESDALKSEAKVNESEAAEVQVAKEEVPATKPEAAARIPTPPIPSHIGPISASATSAGEGGKLAEEDALLYRAKMLEQRRLAKERMASEQK